MLPHVAEIILWLTVISVLTELELAILLLVSGFSKYILSCCCPLDAPLSLSPLGTTALEDDLRVSGGAKLDIQMTVRVAIQSEE